jgi:hypothetical protein
LTLGNAVSGSVDPGHGSLAVGVDVGAFLVAGKAHDLAELGVGCLVTEYHEIRVEIGAAGFWGVHLEVFEFFGRGQTLLTSQGLVFDDGHIFGLQGSF